MPTCCNDLDSLCLAQLNCGSTMVIKTKQKPPVMRSLQSFKIYHESLEMRFGGIDYDLLNCPMYGSATHLNDGTARELLTQKLETNSMAENERYSRWMIGMNNYVTFCENNGFQPTVIWPKEGTCPYEFLGLGPIEPGVKFGHGAGHRFG